MEDSGSQIIEEETPQPTVEVFVYYKRRYVIALLLGLLTATNYYQHFEYNAIADTAADYYGVDVSYINWTALLYNVGCVLFLYPTCRMIDKWGFKTSMVFAAFLNAFGCCIKCVAHKRNDFWILIVGQAFPAFVALFPMSLPPVLGSKWFKSEHVATIIGVNNAFTALGCVIAFLAPTLIFNRLFGYTEIGNAMFLMACVLAVVSCIIFILTVLVVHDEPPTPPSLAQSMRNEEPIPFKILMKNVNYILLVIIFSFVISISQITTVILNQSILAQFKNGNHILTITGILSFANVPLASLLTGFIQSRFKQYKLLLIFNCFLLVVFFGLYTYGLHIRSVAMIYVFIFVAAFVYNGLIVFVQDYIVEATYPYPEGTTMSIATCVASLPGLGFVPLVSMLIKSYGSMKANLVIVALGVVNLLLSFIVTNDLRRHRVQVVNEQSRLLINADDREIANARNHVH